MTEYEKGGQREIMGAMKKLTPSVKYQLLRDGERSNTVYALRRDADRAGRELVDIGWIEKYMIVPVRITWLTIKGGIYQK